MEDVPFFQEQDRRLEEGLVLHAEGDFLQIQCVEVFPVHEGEDLVLGAVLGDIIPRFGIEFRRLVDDVENEGRSGGTTSRLWPHGPGRSYTGRAWGSRTGNRRSACDKAPGRADTVLVAWPLATAIAPIGICDQNRQALTGGCWVRDDHLATINGVDDKFIGDELVVALAVFVP